MLFNFELVIKVDSVYKYKIGGSLTPEVSDLDIFNQVKEAYRSIFESEEVDLSNNLIIKDDCILFVNIDVISMSNIMKVLSNGLGIKVKPVITKNCRFTPASCEHLFKMEVHRLFR